MPEQPISPQGITSITELTASQAETRFDQHYSRDDLRDNTVVGRWFGQAALNLDLKGDVHREDFLALLHGINPKNLAVLNAPATSAAYEYVFASPRSVSIQALVNGDVRLTEAHTKAVAQAIMAMEQQLGKLITAMFFHVATRSTRSSSPKPSLHTHVVVFNLTQG